jgi:hypothetical protein
MQYPRPFVVNPPQNLCLYGIPDGSYVVQTPAEEVPAEAPEPAVGERLYVATQDSCTAAVLLKHE